MRYQKMRAPLCGRRGLLCRTSPSWQRNLRQAQILLPMDNIPMHPGIISWDFSMYRVMPWGLQLWNCYRSRLLGSRFERCRGVCIPNLRPRTLRDPICDFDGLPMRSTVAMSTHGCIRHRDDREVFATYVSTMVPILHPKTIVVYGRAPSDIFESALENGIEIVTFQSDFARAHQSKENK